MLTAIIFLTGIFLVFSFGFQLSRILLPDVEKLEQISLGYILGLGIFTFIWFLLNWAGVPYNLLSGFILLFFLNSIMFAVNKFFVRQKKGRPIIDLSFFKKLDIFEKFLIGIILFLCLSALAQDLYWPVRYWDSLVLYDFRAKVFAQTGFMQAAISRGYFFGYPLLTSLAHSWTYLLGGTNPSFLYGLLYISLLLIFFFNVKKLNIGRTETIFITALAAVSPRLFDHTQWAYTNLPYSIYMILGSIYLFFGIKNKNFGSFVASAILIGLSSWTRSTEPFWLSSLIVGVLSAWLIRKWLWPFVYAGIVLGTMMPWRFFESLHNEGTGSNVAAQIIVTSQGVLQHTNSSILVTALRYLSANFIENYAAFFVIFAIILILKIIYKSRNWLFSSLIIINLFFALAGVIIYVKFVPYIGDLTDSLARMMMFFPPMVIFLLAEFIFENKKHE